MAFSTNNNKATSNESWKATAFINLWVETGNGRIKIGAIPLKEERSIDKDLIEALQQDGAVDALLQNLKLDFQMVNKDSGTGNRFDFLKS